MKGKPLSNKHIPLISERSPPTQLEGENHGRTVSPRFTQGYSTLVDHGHHLVSIKINDHRLLDAFDLTEQKPDRERDVGVDTEAAAMVGTTVVKATTNVDCPASLHRQSRRLSASIHTNTLWHQLQPDQMVRVQVSREQYVSSFMFTLT